MKAFLRVLGFGLAGVAQALSIASPWNGQPVWWLQLLSTAVLVGLLDGLRTSPGTSAGTRPGTRPAWRSAALLGWLFSTAWLCATFWWMFISLHTYGGLAAPLAAVAVLVLAALLALYYVVASALYVAFAPAGVLRGAVFFTALWTVAELLRGTWFTGLPWGAGGYAHVEGPLAPYAPWIGVYGIGAVATLIAALVALAWRRARERSRAALAAPLVVAVALAVLPSAWVGLRGTPADDPSLSRGKLAVALLQGNIPQDEKFVPGGGMATALDWYGRMLGSDGTSLVVTPETALPLLPSQLPSGYLDAITARYMHGQQAAIVGLPLGDGQVYSNSVLGFKPGEAEPYRYDKHHLVPFGEFIPGLFRWFTDMLNIPLGDFASGGLAQPSFAWQGQRIAPNICYEDLFGEEIGARFGSEETAPTILLNVSNLAWFGDSIAIDQHLAISRMRALEFQRPMVRSTNTGATVVIDHHGRVVDQLPRLTRGVLHAEVEGRGGRTPYAVWVSRFGLWPLWGLGLAVIALTLALRQRRRA